MKVFRFLAGLVLIGVAVMLVIKYLDCIVNCISKIKSALFKSSCGCDDFDDVDLEDVCLDPDCPCKDEIEA